MATYKKAPGSRSSAILNVTKKTTTNILFYLKSLKNTFCQPRGQISYPNPTNSFQYNNIYLALPFNGCCLNSPYLGYLVSCLTGQGSIIRPSFNNQRYHWLQSLKLKTSLVYVDLFVSWQTIAHYSSIFSTTDF